MRCYRDPGREASSRPKEAPGMLPLGLGSKVGRWVEDPRCGDRALGRLCPGRAPN